MRFSLSHLAFFLIFGLPAKILAKTVHLEWDALESASKYELKIEKAGVVSLTVVVQNAKWTGDLVPGFHAYSIRAIDESGRTGFWSEPYPIVVLPPAPVLLAPENAKKIEIYPGQPLGLSWQNVDGADHYEVKVQRGTEVIFQGKVKETALQLADLISGNYTWNVLAVVNSGSYYPALSNREWKTPASGTGAFVLILNNLSKPVLSYPLNDIWPSSDGKLEFKWEPVEGAAAYEIRVSEVLTADQKDVKPLEKVLRSESNLIVISVGDHGFFRWSVRALGTAYPSDPSVNEVKTKGLGENISWPQSQAEFHILATEFQNNSGTEISAEIGYGLLTMKNSNPTRNILASVQIDAAPLTLGWTHWLTNMWAFSNHAKLLNFNVGGSKQSLFSVDAMLHRFYDLGFGWSALIEGGLDYRQIPILNPQLGGLATDTASVPLIGTKLGGSISKMMTLRWIQKLQVELFYPNSFLSTDYKSSFSRDDVSDNLSIGIIEILSLNEMTKYHIGLTWQAQEVTLTSVSALYPDQKSNLDGIMLSVGMTYRWPAH